MNDKPISNEATITKAQLKANESIGWYAEGDKVYQVVTISPRKTRYVGRLVGAAISDEDRSKLIDELQEAVPSDIADHTPVRLWGYLADAILAKKREWEDAARVDELRSLDTRRHYGKDYQESLDELDDYKEERLAELDQKETS